MREKIEQFQPLEHPEKPKIGPTEIYLSPERKSSLEVVEQIRKSDRAVKLLTLMEKGYLPSQEELRSISVENLIHELRKKYPTVEDIETDLSETVDEHIGVAYQEGWTAEQYQRATQEKKLQYKKEAVDLIVRALNPVYEKFGALPSEENKARILENLTTILERIDPGNITASQREYVKKNILAALNQELTPEEARRLIQMKQAFFEVWEQAFPGETD